MSLPVFRTAGKGYALLWHHKGRLLRFALLPSALSFAVFLAGQRIMAAFPPAIEIEKLAGLLSQAALVPFVVQAYRLFLLGPGDRSSGSWLWLGSGCSGVLVLAVLSWISLEGPDYAVGAEAFDDLDALLAGDASVAKVAAAGFYHGAFVLYLYVFTRLAFLYPSLSLGEDWDIAARWRETRGYFGRLFGVLVLAFLPSAILLVALAAYVWPLFSALPNEVTAAALEDQHLTPDFAESAVMAASAMVSMVIGFALAAAVVSVA